MNLGDWFSDTALSGSLALAIPVAALAGLISFFSPCVLPLLPGYFSYITGLSALELDEARRGRLLLGSTLFVLGFGSVFVAYGAAFGSLGFWLAENTEVITRTLGVLVIALGFAFAGLLPWFQRDLRFHRIPAVGVGAAPLLGVLFGVGWSPCVGPTLAAVQALAVNEGTVARGALLSGVYALGLGLPFLALAVAYRRGMGAIGVIRRHQLTLMRVGGILLIAVGLLLVTGVWADLIARLQGTINGFEVIV